MTAWLNWLMAYQRPLEAMVGGRQLPLLGAVGQVVPTVAVDLCWLAGPPRGWRPRPWWIRPAARRRTGGDRRRQHACGIPFRLDGGGDPIPRPARLGVRAGPPAAGGQSRRRRGLHRGPRLT